VDLTFRKGEGEEFEPYCPEATIRNRSCFARTGNSRLNLRGYVTYLLLSNSESNGDLPGSCFYRSLSA